MGCLLRPDHVLRAALRCLSGSREAFARCTSVTDWAGYAEAPKPRMGGGVEPLLVAPPSIRGAAEKKAALDPLRRSALDAADGLRVRLRALRGTISGATSGLSPIFLYLYEKVWLRKVDRNGPFIPA